MKKLLILILISCSITASAQNITLTKADTAKSNTAIRTLQSQYAGLPKADTVKSFQYINGVAYVRWDKVDALITQVTTLSKTVVDLSADTKTRLQSLETFKTGALTSISSKADTTAVVNIDKRLLLVEARPTLTQADIDYLKSQAAKVPTGVNLIYK